MSQRITGKRALHNRTAQNGKPAETIPHVFSDRGAAVKDYGVLLENKASEAVAATTEAARDEKLKQVTGILSGTSSVELANLLLHQVETVQKNTFPCADPKDATKTATASLATMQPRNFLEGTLIAQMVQTHHAVSEFLRRATHPEQMVDAADRNVNRAVRLGRLFTEQIEALQKLRGQSGQQKVVVEHVNVAPGAQAIVGTVTSNGPEGRK